VGCIWDTDCVLLGVTDDQAVTASAGAITEITIPDSGRDPLILTVAVSSEQRWTDEPAAKELTDSFLTASPTKTSPGQSSR
jgi:hypothetical protein